ncbi:hypothetical protein, conserved [Eimeria tenella]|uniref:Uncharacterized protein n=1 Tax=Eimeria tenella TaxID=5802 RepID=U6L5N0_EIMTE|nr:hypothetical protein, conserved [Eimeria tenella]CDJ43100.1 hypothetical protein, conserved [Eimeria tenella]|eukprot:XP_013233850.1 hypothetical protein, conserved [Eimeria tenella]
MGSTGEFRRGGAKRDPTGTLHGSSCGRVKGSDIEIYAYQLEAAVAALTAFRMTRQIRMMTELMHQHISLLRYHCSTCSIGSISSISSSDSDGCVPPSDFTPDSVPLLCPPPPSLHPTPVTVAAGVGAAAAAAHTADKTASDYSWLFPSVGAESPLELGMPQPHRSLCKRAVNRGPLEMELRAAVAGAPGSLQWLHALSRIATDEQASQTILDMAAADPGFPGGGVQRQVLLALCSLAVDTSRIHDTLNAVFGPPDQSAVTEEQRIGKIIKKMTEAGALQEQQATEAGMREGTTSAFATAASERQQGAAEKQKQQVLQFPLLQKQTLFAGAEAWSFLWHLVGLAYQRGLSKQRYPLVRPAVVASSDAAPVLWVQLCGFLAAAAGSHLQRDSTEATKSTLETWFRIRSHIMHPATFYASATAAFCLVCSDTSFFLLVPPRQSPTQFLDAALNPNRVGRIMRRFCCLLLLQQQRAATRMQHQLEEQLEQVETQLKLLQQQLQSGPVDALQLSRGLWLEKQHRNLRQQQRQQQQWLRIMRAQQQRRWQLLQNELLWRSGSRLFSHTMRVIGTSP